MKVLEKEGVQYVAGKEKKINLGERKEAREPIKPVF